jgi:hypothetical protein
MTFFQPCLIFLASITIVAVVHLTATEIQAANREQSCASFVEADSDFFEERGGTYSVAYSAPATCQWTVSSTVDWIKLENGPTFTGTATAIFRVAPNLTNDRRSGQVIFPERSIREPRRRQFHHPE